MEEYLSTKEALELIRAQGRKISSQGLIWIGVKYGISRKAPDGHHWEYNKRLLTDWINNSEQPEVSSKGFIPIKDAAEKTEIPLNTIYYWTKTGKLPFEKIGNFPEKIYVDLKELEKIKEQKDNK